ncbi:MAG TPA: hypothetical protein VHU44_13810, partial [Acidobacteriaceae bacterium]|nr:hypothetical protein [Acidobacteriaceae bacterium]
LLYLANMSGEVERPRRKWRVDMGVPITPDPIEADERPLNRLHRLAIDFVRFDHLRKLIAVNKGNEAANEEHGDFQEHFPSWRLIGLAVASISILSWRWFNLRTERRIVWGYWAFWFGIIEWCWTIHFFTGISLFGHN